MSLKLGSNDTAILAGSSVVKQILLGSSPKFAAPVLDHVPGAAAAYSLRRLSNAYAGPVVKVRRSSDSATADFTAAEVVDGTLTAWVGAGDGFVDTWYDQSGNVRHATQATAGYQPKVVSSGAVVTEGGKPAVQFDGIDDRLSFSDIETDSAVSTFTVTRRQAAGLRSVILSSATVGSGTLSAYEFSDNKTYVGNRTGYIVSDSALSEQVLYSTFSPDYLSTVGMSLYRHGALLATTSGALAASATINSIGKRASEYATGTAQELIIYPSDVSASRELAEGEMAWHYGLQAKLPYNHAYAPQALGGASQTVPTDSDAIAYLAAVGAADGAAVERSVAIAIDDFVKGLKADGLWSAIGSACVLAGARTVAGALVPLKGASPTGYNWVASDYSRSLGLKGDGSTKYIDSNRANDADGQDDVHLAAYVTTAATGNTYVIGSNDGGSVHSIAGVGYWCRTGSGETGTAPAAGMHAISRAASSGFQYIKASGGVLASTKGSSAITSQRNAFVFAYNNNLAPAGMTDARLAFYSLGQSLDLALLDARVSALMSALGAAL